MASNSNEGTADKPFVILEDESEIKSPDDEVLLTNAIAQAEKELGMVKVKIEPGLGLEPASKKGKGRKPKAIGEPKQKKARVGAKITIQQGGQTITMKWKECVTVKVKPDYIVVRREEDGDSEDD